ncbi:MAG: hypothetical protein HQL97_01035 [Magnetococcales bacterium]|nr:hypothetical protein [Magnetococcales bacterium]
MKITQIDIYPAAEGYNFPSATVVVEDDAGNKVQFNPDDEHGSRQFAGVWPADLAEGEDDRNEWTDEQIEEARALAEEAYLAAIA